MTEWPDDTPLDMLPLPVRLINGLKWGCDIVTLGPARKMSDEALLRLPNLGKVTVKEFRKIVGYSSVPRIPDQTIEEITEAVIDRLRPIILDELRNRIA